MDNLDTLAPNYRRAQQRWPSAPTLADGYDALAICFYNSAHGLVELVKSFIESVCLTILSEFGQQRPSNNPNSTELLVAALDALGLSNTKGATKLDAVLSGFNRLSDALSEMRNETGPVAHGKDGFLDSVTIDHTRAFLHVGDAILGVLLNALEGKDPDLVVTHEPYETFKDYNDRIDRDANVQVQIDEEGDRPIIVFSVTTGSPEEAIELRVEPSRLLYGTDRQAYIAVLETTKVVSAVAVDEAKEEKEKEEVTVSEFDDTPSVTPVEAVGPVTAVMSVYGGTFDTLRSGLKTFLTLEGVTPTVTAGKEQLIDSLLATVDTNMALDWRNREPIQARIKVACKRVLVRFGTESEKADEVAKRIVTWLSQQATNEDGKINIGSHSVKGENGP